MVKTDIFCVLVEVRQCFEEKHCLHFQGQEVSQARHEREASIK
jgi:hypothetical protein